MLSGQSQSQELENAQVDKLSGFQDYNETEGKWEEVN